MRVARIITRLNVGGPAIHVANLTKGLADRGVETLLIHGSLGDAEGDMSYLLDGAAPGTEILPVPALRRSLAPADDVRAWWQIYGALRRFRPHVVHTHTAKAGAIGRSAAIAYNRTLGRHPRTRIVHTYHGHVLDGYFSPAVAATFVSIERALAKASDRLIVVSPRVHDDLARSYRIGRPDQYRVVTLGFDLARFAQIDAAARIAARTALAIPSDARVVTTIGRLTAIKDHALFLAVAQRIAREVPEAIFLIAGDGELRARLEDQARALGIGDRVRFLGWRRDLDVLYAATDVFLLTSKNEGTPVALIESLASACAAVSTDVGGVRDVIESETVGRVAPNGDASRLASHVVALLQNRTLRQDLGASGRRMALARYGVDRLLGDVHALYRELTA